jgi:hypothetical protein
MSNKGIATIKRRIAKMPYIRYVGSGYSGHWEVLDQELTHRRDLQQWFLLFATNEMYIRWKCETCLTFLHFSVLTRLHH